MKPFVADVHMHSLLSGHAFGTIRELAAEASRPGTQPDRRYGTRPRHSQDS